AEQIVDRLGVGLAAACLHNLSDEPAKHGRLGPYLGDLIRITGNDLIDCPFDGGGVGDLREPAGCYNVAGASAFTPHDFKHILGDLAGNCPVGNQFNDLTELNRGNRSLFNGFAFAVQPAKELVNDPIGGDLAVTAARNRLEIAGGSPLSDQDRRVIE